MFIIFYRMDTDKKSVVLKTKADLNIIADLNIKFTKKNNKSFDGLYKATTSKKVYHPFLDYSHPTQSSPEKLRLPLVSCYCSHRHCKQAAKYRCQN